MRVVSGRRKANTVVDLTRLYQAIVEGDDREAKRVVDEALREDVNPCELIARYMTPAMDEVGRRFDAGDYFYAELFIAGSAMKAALGPLIPLIATADMGRLGRVLIGTVEGDLHDIGKNLVIAMLEGAGFEVIDLGVDVAPKIFVEKVKQEAPDIVALSCLLTVAIPAVKAVIAALEREGVRDSVKVMVGGAAITKSLANEVGADGYAPEAGAAVPVARALFRDQMEHAAESNARRLKR
jgi:5-methyltetrahydrofolate--homocysteine methyltransferase